MQQKEIDRIFLEQREYFNTGETLSVAFRIEMLKRLKKKISENEQNIIAALKSDLGKGEFEAYMCEVGMTLSELSYMIKHTARFAKAKRVKTPLAHFAAKSFVKPQPYGNTLIMSPWNYPFLLTVGPLADAIAAGNCAIVKPSAYSPATSELIARLIGEIFPEKYIAVVTGGREENRRLLELKFDFVFFTGSQAVGKEVLRHTAEHLTPTVLELGGKSPCIVDESAKLSLAARRIVFGKLINCGQTCVAPDYILCHRSVADELSREIVSEIKRQYGERPLDNPEYGRIVNKKHYERLLSLIDREKVIFGGESDDEALRIAPTVMTGVGFDDAVMGEEIFGPIIPILTYDSFEELYGLMQEREKPLAFYVFSENRARANDLISRCQFGGGCINDTIIHLATSEMGFGGVGESGMGAYHGRAGFDAFSHRKSIVDKKTAIDLPMRYQPYGKKYLKLIKMLLK